MTTKIEVYEWKQNPDKPKGYVVVDRVKNTREFVDEINLALPDELSRELEYPFSEMMEKEIGETVDFPAHSVIAVFPLPGANEGYYIHVVALDGDRRYTIALAKCWDWDLAWRLARYVADLVVEE